MTDEYITVSIAKDVADLIPTFLENRAKEVETLRTLIATSDMKRLNLVGHRMRGAGTPFGFERVSVLGKQIQDCVKAGDYYGIRKCINDYADYLKQVRVVYE